MGETEYWDEFAKLDANTNGISGSSAGERIHFDQTLDKLMEDLNDFANHRTLAEVAFMSRNGGYLDIKTWGDLTNGNPQEGYKLGKYFASVRSAGNYLAGLNAATNSNGGQYLSPEQIQKVFGAYQQGGGGIKGLIAAVKTARTGNAAPGTSAPYWGEQQYSGRMQQEGETVGVGWRH
jgi:hypothetical protein